MFGLYNYQSLNTTTDGGTSTLILDSWYLSGSHNGPVYGSVIILISL